jgi:hypothetical protein
MQVIQFIICLSASLMDYGDEIVDYDVMLCFSMYRHVLLIGFSWVCRTLDRLRMSMASMDLLGLWIELGSGMHMV